MTTVRTWMRALGAVLLGAAAVSAAPAVARAQEGPCEWVGTYTTTDTLVASATSPDMRRVTTITVSVDEAGTCRVERHTVHQSRSVPTQTVCGPLTTVTQSADARTTADFALTLRPVVDPAGVTRIRPGVTLTAPAIPVTVTTTETNTCDGTVISSTTSVVDDFGIAQDRAMSCLNIANHPQPEVPSADAQAVQVSCSGGYLLAGDAKSLRMVRTTCDPGVDSDGDGEGDCAEYAAGRNPSGQEPNAAPVANPDVARTSPRTPVTIDVLANDTDPDADPLHIRSCTQPTTGTVTTDGRTVVLTPTTPRTGHTVTFTCTIPDPSGLTATADVVVSLGGKKG